MPPPPPPPPPSPLLPPDYMSSWPVLAPHIQTPLISPLASAMLQHKIDINPNSCYCNDCILTVPVQVDYIKPMEDPHASKGRNTCSPSNRDDTGHQRGSQSRLYHHPLPEYLTLLSNHVSPTPIPTNSSTATIVDNTPYHTRATIAYVKAMATRIFLAWTAEGVGVTQHYTISTLDTSPGIPENPVLTGPPLEAASTHSDLLNENNWNAAFQLVWHGPNPAAQPGMKECTYSSILNTAEAGMNLTLMGFPGTLEGLQPHRFEVLPAYSGFTKHGQFGVDIGTPRADAASEAGCRRTYGVKVHDKRVEAGTLNRVAGAVSAFSYYPDLNDEVQDALVKLMVPRAGIELLGISPHEQRFQQQIPHGHHARGAISTTTSTVTTTPSGSITPHSPLLSDSRHNDNIPTARHWLEVVQRAYMYIANEWLLEYQKYVNMRLSHVLWRNHQQLSLQHTHLQPTGPPFPLPEPPAPPSVRDVIENQFRIIRALQEVSILNELVLAITKPRGSFVASAWILRLNEDFRTLVMQDQDAKEEVERTVPGSGYARRQKEKRLWLRKWGMKIPPEYHSSSCWSGLYRRIVRDSWGMKDFGYQWLGDCVPPLTKEEEKRRDPRIEEEIRVILGRDWWELTGTVSPQDLALKGAAEPVDDGASGGRKRKCKVAGSVQAMVQLRKLVGVKRSHPATGEYREVEDRELVVSKKGARKRVKLTERAAEINEEVGSQT